jgi:uncharacterized protein YebE (UPF0316 family)
MQKPPFKRNKLQYIRRSCKNDIYLRAVCQKEHIISEKYEQINHEILTSLERGSTIITAKGGYTGESRPMLMVSFTKSQYASFMAIISRIDKNAFVTIHLAHGIEGEGWTKNDTKAKKENHQETIEEDKQ